MRTVVFRQKHVSFCLGLAGGLAILSMAAGLWLSMAGTPAAASVPPTFQAALAPGATQVITIGVAADLSGGAASFGWPEANAVRLAVDQVNEAGGLDVGGVAYLVVLVTADDQCSSGQAPAVAQTLLGAGAVGVIGHTCSGASIAAEPAYAAAGVAMISPSSTGPAVTQQGYNTTFRTITHDGSPPATLARYMRLGLGLERSAFVAYAGTPMGGASYYSTTFTSLAGTMTGLHLLADTAEFTATLTAIKHDEQPQAIFYADTDAGRAGLFSRVAYDVGMDDVVIAWTPWDAMDAVLDAYQAAAGGAADGDVIGMQYRRFDDMPGWPAFLAAYQAAGFPNYGDDPAIFGSFAYDAARILLAAIDRADSTDPAAIRDQVAATQDLVGVVGNYRGFDSRGDVVPQWGWLEQNQAGKWVDLEFYSWYDGFDATTLGPSWSWVRQDPTHWSLSDRPGFLRITTQAGGLYAGRDNAQQNLLLMPAPPGDLSVTTRLFVTPTENYHQAGLLFYQDEDNYVRLNRVYNDGQYVELIGEVGGTAVYTDVPEAATTLYLQLLKRGDTYEGYYSLDRAGWTPVGRYSAGLSDLKVGLGANHDLPGPPEILVDFGWFQVDGALAGCDYARADYFDKGLQDRWSWIRENPTHWSLDDRPGSMQITTQDGTLFGPGGDAHNLLLQSAPPADLSISTRVAFTPTEDLQTAGLLLYQDDDNYLLLGRAYCDVPGVCAGNAIYFDHEEDGNAIGSNFTTAVPLPYLAHLQLVRAGLGYWGFFSEDGIHWTLIGHHLAAQNFWPARLGLAAYGGSTGADEIDAAFDYFRLEADYLRAFLPLVLKVH